MVTSHAHTYHDPLANCFVSAHHLRRFVTRAIWYFRDRITLILGEHLKIRICIAECHLMLCQSLEAHH